MSSAGVQPEPRADLGHAHQGDREQPGLLVGQAGVLVDHLGDRLGALAGDPVDPLAHRRLVGEVGLEDQPEGALGAGDVVVEDVHGRGDAHACCRRSTASAVVARLDDRVARLVEQREVELELAREVLVEHRLGDAGPLGDVVHRGGVVALGDEDLQRGLEQLGAPGGARHPAAAGLLVVGRRHAQQPTLR